MRGQGEKWCSSLRIYVLVSLAGQEGRKEKRQRRIRNMRRGVRLVVSTWRVMPRRPACPTVSPIYNLCTRAALPCITLLTLSSFFFFFQFCRGLGRWVGDHPQEDLTRFGYTSERKLVATLRIPPIFWRDVGTYCLNMATSEFFLHNVVIWAHFPLYHFAPLSFFFGQDVKIWLFFFFLC